jgi:LacI family transcriptional regulator
VVTLEDIARKAGVSLSTASRALNDSPFIKEETKSKVKRIAKELGYEKNELARGLAKGSIKIISLVISDISNPFFSEIARGVEDAANARGYGMILCNTDRDPEKEGGYMRMLKRSRVAGLILASATVDDSYIKDLSQSETPLILISRTSKADTSYIIIDDFKGGLMATEYLVKLGHQRIGFIGGPKGLTSTMGRIRGYQKALKRNGIPLYKEIVRYADFTREAGYHAMREYLKLSKLPTAIFGANDMIALGVIEAVEEAGLSVPDDISVIGYDNISYASLPKIELTTIAQPIYDMGFAATEYILDVAEGGREKKLKRILKPQLIIRKTCKPWGKKVKVE